MKQVLWLCLLLFVSGFGPLTAQQGSEAIPAMVRISPELLKDKIMGGWAGQTIGVTFGGPYEFRFDGSFIQDYQPLLWYDGYIKKTMLENPGLYDDLYMDLTFVDVFRRNGLDAPLDSFAHAFANAGYMLWHANQSARYNILHGIRPSVAGFWMNNPHADDIDYQIESDYAGLMSPALPDAASAISDKIGHMMNYGDGWYGGVYIGALYSLSFVFKDIGFIVGEALKAIPPQSNFYQCISDVIKWHRQYPSNWKNTWFELQQKWSSDIGCPDGIFDPFDIDAKLNAAYVVMALLYGQGDFGKTLEVAARAGEDADCNPSSAGGILGALLGYSRIPAYWKMGLKEAEDINFKYTSISLNQVYRISYDQALENIRRNGGKTGGDSIEIPFHEPTVVHFEQSFPDTYPVIKEDFDHSITENSFDFDGTGFVLRGSANKKTANLPDYVFKAKLIIDGRETETAELPTNFTLRRNEIFWKYGLSKQHHHVIIKLLNPAKGYELRSSDYIVFSDRPGANPGNEKK
jgi:ADP-ribosylglycohydrolase